MRSLANISEANIYDSVNYISSTTDQDSSALIALEANDYLIKSNNKDFNLIKTQFKNTKNLYHNNLISDLDYKKYKNYYEIAWLKKRINDYNEYFSSNYKDTEKISIAIDEIKKSCQNKTILKLPYKYLKKITILINTLQNVIERSSDIQKSKLSYKLNKLVNNHLSKTIAYNDILQKQSITVDITPINSDFTLKDINFSSTENKRIFNEKKLTLKNLHIKDLKIKEYLYGLEGTINFQLVYPNNHPDFEFLLNASQPILLDIQIQDTFNFLKKGSKTDRHERLTRFVAIGNITALVDIEEKYEFNLFSFNEDKTTTNIKEFKIEFNDPLKSLWSLHKPTYVDIKKTLDDVIKDNFFFEKLITLDTNKSENLKNRLPQIFVSTINRNFYDFFIEQIQINKCVIKYFCDKKTGKVTYYIVDKIDDSLKKNVANTDEELEQKLSPYDINSFKNQKLLQQELIFYIKQNRITPNVTLNSDRKSTKSTNNSSKPFSSVYEDVINPTFYHQHEEPDEIKEQGYSYALKLSTKNTLPFIDSDISLSSLQANDHMLGSKNLKNFCISERTIQLKRSRYSTQKLYEDLNDFYYKSNSNSDTYEKVIFCSYPSLTHQESITYKLLDYAELGAEYPYFIPFEPLNIIGRVTIGDNVNKDSKKAYKFFKNFKPEESSFAEFQENGEKGTPTIFNSKLQLFYAIEIPKEILGPKCSEKPILYMPSKINVNSANNQFMPLRNDDIVITQLQSISTCEITQIISNTAISTDKAQKQLLQRQLLGAKENCEIAYTQASDDETYSITQLNEKNESSFFINNKNGIFLRYKAKGN